MKKTVMALAALSMMIGFSSCQPKKSAYRQAYEQAKQREIAVQDDQTSKPQEDVSVSRPASDYVSARKEKISPIQGEDGNNLKQFSVVIGSFQNATNARSLKDRMVADGYNAVLAQNEFGMLRVIVSSFPTKEEAAASRDAIKARYTPNFQDAWLLERTF